MIKRTDTTEYVKYFWNVKCYLLNGLDEVKRLTWFDQPLHYGIIDYEVFKREVQNYKDYCLRNKASKWDKIWLSKSILYVKNHLSLSNFFIEEYQFRSTVFVRDHSSITSSNRWVGGVRNWHFLIIYSTVNSSLQCTLISWKRDNLDIAIQWVGLNRSNRSQVKHLHYLYNDIW